MKIEKVYKSATQNRHHNNAPYCHKDDKGNRELIDVSFKDCLKTALNARQEEDNGIYRKSFVWQR